MTVVHFITIKDSPPKVFLRKGVLKLCSKFAGEHSYRSAISINLLCNFGNNGCSPVNLLHIFITRFSKKTPGRLLLSLHDVSFIIPISIRASLCEFCKMKIFSEVVSFISCRGFSKFYQIKKIAMHHISNEHKIHL